MTSSMGWDSATWSRFLRDDNFKPEHYPQYGALSARHDAFRRYRCPLCGDHYQVAQTSVLIYEVSHGTNRRMGPSRTDIECDVPRCVNKRRNGQHFIGLEITDVRVTRPRNRRY